MSNKYQKVSTQTQDEASKTAKATQRPGQTKEQTKLIAQGIQKGIEQYKKQQKEKARELNKKLHKVSRQLTEPNSSEEVQNQIEIVYKQNLLPWILLVFSWIGFLGYIYYFLPGGLV